MHPRRHVWPQRGLLSRQGWGGVQQVLDGSIWKFLQDRHGIWHFVYGGIDAHGKSDERVCVLSMRRCVRFVRDVIVCWSLLVFSHFAFRWKYIHQSLYSCLFIEFIYLITTAPQPLLTDANSDNVQYFSVPLQHAAVTQTTEIPHFEVSLPLIVNITNWTISSI